MACGASTRPPRARAARVPNQPTRPHTRPPLLIACQVPARGHHSRAAARGRCARGPRRSAGRGPAGGVRAARGAGGRGADRGTGGGRGGVGAAGWAAGVCVCVGGGGQPLRAPVHGAQCAHMPACLLVPPPLACLVLPGAASCSLRTHFCLARPHLTHTHTHPHARAPARAAAALPWTGPSSGRRPAPAPAGCWRAGWAPPTWPPPLQPPGPRLWTCPAACAGLTVGARPFAGRGGAGRCAHARIR